MKRFNLFSSPGSPGDSRGIRVTAVRKSPQVAYALERDHWSSPDLESVNAITNENRGFEGAHAAEPSTCPQVPSFLQISDYMKRIMLLCGLLTAFFLSFAAPIKFQKSIPESGSYINSLEFTLEFDISEALQIASTEKPGIVYGLGYMGSANLNATLYKGDVNTGIVIGQVNTSNFTGKSVGFQDNGNTIQVIFDSTIPIVANQEYTLVITNKFYLYQSGKITKLASTESDYSTEPIILKYIGITSEKPQLDVVNSNMDKEQLDLLTNVEFSLSSPFNITNEAEVLIKENGMVVARTTDLKVSSTDNKVLVAEFNGVPLLWGHSYTVELPANSLTHIDDPSVGNFIYKVNVNGSHTYKLALAASKVDVDSKGMPTAVTFEYDMPDGTTLNGMNVTGARDGFLSIEGKEETTNLSGKHVYLANGKGIIWNLSDVTFEPATKYVFSKPGDTVIVWDANNTSSTTGRLIEYSGDDASVSFTTPSVEDLNITPITVGSVKVGQHDDKSVPEFIEGGTYATIDRLEIMKVAYQYEGQSYKTTLNWDEKTCYVYDITDGTRKLIKEILIGAAEREDYYEYYGVFTLYPQMNFLQGHTYEIVIPSGVIRLSDNKPLYNYAMNDEIVFTVIGATPAKFTVESCSVDNNTEMSAVPAAIVWGLNGAYELKSSGITAVAKFSGNMLGNSTPAVNIYKNGWKTYIQVPLTDMMTGKVQKLQKGATFTVTIPAGVIVYPGEETLSNPELIVTIKGIDEVIPEAETVNVNFAVNGLHTTSHPSVKGKPYTLTLTPEENWVVESVKHGDKMLVSKNGAYVTEPLDKDADITATLAYDGPWAVEVSTGVWEIQDSNIQIFKENGQIIVSGATPDKTISVYTTAGMLVNTAHAVEGMDRVHISAATGQTYIVIVDGKAAKIQL